MAKGNKSHQYNTWWIKTPVKTEEKNHSFSEELQHLMYNLTLHCYRWLVEPKISNWETFLWILLHICGGSTVIFVLMSAWSVYSTNPMITTLYDTLYPIRQVPFPGVAICSNNRISHSAAILYSKQLSEKYKSRFNETYFLDNVWLLGKLYDNEGILESEAITFQTYLDMFESNDSLNLSNVTAVMKKLSPQCADMLLRCIWRGVEMPCMVKQTMNEFRRTQYGYCCTFNYVRTDVLQEHMPDSYFIEETGPDLGLILLVDGSLNDYSYPFFSFRGFIVQIFNSHEFPDMPSGGVSEKLVEVGTETFIRIDSTTLITDEETRRYSAETRRCLFSNEWKEEYGDNYRRSDCVVNCRISSIFSLCECIPFFLPIMKKKSELFNLELAQKCALHHLSCLNHYRGMTCNSNFVAHLYFIKLDESVRSDLKHTENIKWSTFLLKLDRLPGLDKDIEDGLYCPQCLPTCSETVYSVKATALPLLQPKRNNHNILSDVNVSDVALIRIYHGQPETWMYKQMAAIKWYEIISNLGGICGVITGFSLISLVEIMYFIIRRIILAICSIYFKSTRRDETLNIMP